MLAKVMYKHDFVLAYLQLTDSWRFEPWRWLLYFHQAAIQKAFELQPEDGFI